MKVPKFLLIALASICFCSGCGNSNNDQEFLDKLNSALNVNKESIQTCYDAIKVVENAGYEINDYSISDNLEFVYDSVAKQFVIMQGDEIVKTSGEYTKRESTLDYFKSVFVYNPNLKYSQYLDKRAKVPESLLITTGFDIGDHKDIPNIAYTNLSGKSHEVIIRTYSDYFSLLAPLDTVHHYEIATNVIVNEIAKLDEHAETAYMRAMNGFINFSKDSSTDIFEVDNGCEEKVSIEVEDLSKFYCAVNIDKTKSGKEVTQLVAESVSNIDNFKKCLSDKVTSFIRFTDDIVVDNECITFTKPIVLDLNGYKLTLNNGSDEENLDKHVAIKITGNTSAYILDSQGVLDDNSGIFLNNSLIAVKGSENCECNLVINGGKITQSVYDIVSPAILCVGNTNSDSKEYKANVLMYGGKVETKLANDCLAVDTSCFSAVGKGAFVDIVYGNLISDTYCINGPKNEGSYDFSGANLEINGGHFKSSLQNRGACICFYENCTINIDGGTFTGSSAVSCCEGQINVMNAKIDATATYHSQTPLADGSAFDFYLIKNGAKIAFTVSDCVINSVFGYIVSASSALNISGKGNLSLQSGEYGYFKGDGVNNLDPSSFKIDLSGNSNWIKHEFPN